MEARVFHNFKSNISTAKDTSYHLLKDVSEVVFKKGSTKSVTTMKRDINVESFLRRNSEHFVRWRKDAEEGWSTRCYKK